MGSLVCRQLVDSIDSLVDYPTSGARHREAWGLESVAWKSIRLGMTVPRRLPAVPSVTVGHSYFCSEHCRQKFLAEASGWSFGRPTVAILDTIARQANIIDLRLAEVNSPWTVG